ncbi:MAG: hypothetical protein NTX91_04990 [candidate division SR1 bacterium]|nr:hypothetical protein [candidate division SR1 bacterium]
MISKKHITTKTIIGAAFSYMIGMSFVHGARLYIDPDAAGLTKNCPSEINIMLDTQGENSVAAEVAIFFDTGAIEPVSFIYGNAFEGGGLMQIIDNKIRILGFDVNNRNGKFLFGTLIIKSKGETKNTNLSFQDKKGNTASYISYGGKNLPLEFGNGAYSFFDGACPQVGTGEKGVGPKQDNEIIASYQEQFKTLANKKLQEQRIKRIAEILGIVFLSIMIAFLGYKRFTSITLYKRGK